MLEMMQGDARQLRHVLRPSIKILPSLPSLWRSWPLKIAISLHSILILWFQKLKKFSVQDTWKDKKTRKEKNDLKIIDWWESLLNNFLKKPLEIKNLCYLL